MKALVGADAWPSRHSELQVSGSRCWDGWGRQLRPTAYYFVGVSDCRNSELSDS